MAGPDMRELRDLAIERVIGVVAGPRRRRTGAEQPVLIVACNARREHVLPRILVAALADEALLVAIIDGRHAAHRQKHRLGEHVALQHLVVTGIGARVTDAPADMAGRVMIADECRQLESSRSAAFV